MCSVLHHKSRIVQKVGESWYPLVWIGSSPVATVPYSRLATAKIRAGAVGLSLLVVQPLQVVTTAGANHEKAVPRGAHEGYSYGISASHIPGRSQG